MTHLFFLRARRFSRRWARPFGTNLLAAVYVATNVTGLYSAEAGFWKDRRTAARRQATDTLLALGSSAVPGAEFIPALNPLAITEGLPASQRALPPGAEERWGWLPDLVSPFGTIGAVSLSKNPKAPLVIHLQDAHESVQAQRSQAGLIEALGRRGVRLVGLEGAVGPFAIDPYRSFPNRDIHRGVADLLLRLGYIGGPEFAGFSAETPPLLWGVENQSLYGQNLSAFSDSETKRSRFLGTLSVLSDLSERATARVYSPGMKEFDARSSAYIAGRETLGGHVRYLWEIFHGPAGEYPNLALLYRALGAEEKMDFKAVEAERRTLVEILVQRLTPVDLKIVVDQSVRYRLGQLSHADYHEFLRSVAERNGVSLERFAHVNGYMDYLAFAEKIHRDALLTELDSLERAVESRLARTPEEISLAKTRRDLVLLSQLARHAMTPVDWRAYPAVKASLAGLPRTLAGLSGRPAPPDTEVLTPAFLASFEDFSSCAIKRNGSLVNNLLEKMRAEKAPIAVLVAGGFHTAGVTALLKQSDVSYVVVTPRLGEIPKDSPPLSLLVRDPLPLEKLLAGDVIHLQSPRLSAESLAAVPASMQPRVRFEKKAMDGVLLLASASLGLLIDGKIPSTPPGLSVVATTAVETGNEGGWVSRLTVRLRAVKGEGEEKVLSVAVAFKTHLDKDPALFQSAGLSGEPVSEQTVSTSRGEVVFRVYPSIKGLDKEKLLGAVGTLAVLAGGAVAWAAGADWPDLGGLLVAGFGILHQRDFWSDVKTWEGWKTKTVSLPNGNEVLVALNPKGKRKPLVWVPGGGADPALGRQRDLFDQYRALIVPKRAPLPAPDRLVSDPAADLIQVLKGLENAEGGFHVAGHSLGALTLLHLVSDADPWVRQRLLSVTLLNPAVPHLARYERILTGIKSARVFVGLAGKAMRSASRLFPWAGPSDRDIDRWTLAMNKGALPLMAEMWEALVGWPILPRGQFRDLTHIENEASAISHFLREHFPGMQNKILARFKDLPLLLLYSPQDFLSSGISGLAGSLQGTEWASIVHFKADGKADPLTLHSPHGSEAHASGVNQAILDFTEIVESGRAPPQIGRRAVIKTVSQVGGGWVLTLADRQGNEIGSVKLSPHARTVRDSISALSRWRGLGIPLVDGEAPASSSLFQRSFGEYAEAHPDQLPGIHVFNEKVFDFRGAAGPSFIALHQDLLSSQTAGLLPSALAVFHEFGEHLAVAKKLSFRFDRRTQTLRFVLDGRVHSLDLKDPRAVSYAVRSDGSVHHFLRALQIELFNPMDADLTETIRTSIRRNRPTVISSPVFEGREDNLEDAWSDLPLETNLGFFSGSRKILEQANWNFSRMFLANVEISAQGSPRFVLTGWDETRGKPSGVVSPENLNPTDVVVFWRPLSHVLRALRPFENPNAGRTPFDIAPKIVDSFLDRLPEGTSVLVLNNNTVRFSQEPNDFVVYMGMGEAGLITHLFLHSDFMPRIAAIVPKKWDAENNRMVWLRYPQEEQTVGFFQKYKTGSQAIRGPVLVAVPKEDQEGFISVGLSAAMGAVSILALGFVSGFIPFPEVSFSWAAGSSVGLLLGFGGRQPNGIPPGYFGISPLQKTLRLVSAFPRLLLTIAADIASLRRSAGIGASNRNGGSGTFSWPRPVEGSEAERRVVRRHLEKAGEKCLVDWGIGPSSEVASIGPGSFDFLQKETTAAFPWELLALKLGARVVVYEPDPNANAQWQRYRQSLPEEMGERLTVLAPEAAAVGKNGITLKKADLVLLQSVLSDPRIDQGSKERIRDQVLQTADKVLVGWYGDINWDDVRVGGFIKSFGWKGVLIANGREPDHYNAFAHEWVTFDLSDSDARGSALRKAPSPQRGGRWPWLNGFYGLAGGGWWGRVGLPVLAESVLPSVLMVWAGVMPGVGFAAPLWGLVFQSAWHAAHLWGAEGTWRERLHFAFSAEKLAITAGVLLSLSVFSAAAGFLDWSSTARSLAWVAGVAFPHALVNGGVTEEEGDVDRASASAGNGNRWGLVPLFAPVAALGTAIMAAGRLVVYRVRSRRVGSRVAETAEVVVLGGGSGAELLGRVFRSIPAIQGPIKAVMSNLNDSGRSAALQSVVERVWKLHPASARSWWRALPRFLAKRVDRVPVSTVPYMGYPMRAIEGGVARPWVRLLLAAEITHFTGPPETWWVPLLQNEEVLSEMKNEDPIVKDAILAAIRTRLQAIPPDIQEGIRADTISDPAGRIQRPQPLRDLLYLGALFRDGAVSSPGILRPSAYYRAVDGLVRDLGSSVVPVLAGFQSAKDVQLVGVDVSGREALGEKAIGLAQEAGPFARIDLADLHRGNRRNFLPFADPEALRAINECQEIVIGPGSLTSLFGALAPEGIVESLIQAKRRGAKITWLFNPTQNPDTEGLTPLDVVNLLERSLSTDKRAVALRSFLTDVVVNVSVESAMERKAFLKSEAEKKSNLAGDPKTNRWAAKTVTGFWETRPPEEIQMEMEERLGARVFVSSLARRTKEGRFHYHPHRLLTWFALKRQFEAYGRLVGVFDKDETLTPANTPISIKTAQAMARAVRAGAVVVPHTASSFEELMKDLKWLFLVLTFRSGGRPHLPAFLLGNHLPMIASIMDARLFDRTSGQYQPAMTEDLFTIVAEAYEANVLHEGGKVSEGRQALLDQARGFLSAEQAGVWPGFESVVLAVEKRLAEKGETLDSHRDALLSVAQRQVEELGGAASDREAPWVNSLREALNRPSLTARNILALTIESWFARAVLEQERSSSLKPQDLSDRLAGISDSFAGCIDLISEAVAKGSHFPAGYGKMVSRKEREFLWPETVREGLERVHLSTRLVVALWLEALLARERIHPEVYGAGVERRPGAPGETAQTLPSGVDGILAHRRVQLVLRTIPKAHRAGAAERIQAEIEKAGLPLSAVVAGTSSINFIPLGQSKKDALALLVYLYHLESTRALMFADDKPDIDEVRPAAEAVNVFFSAKGKRPKNSFPNTTIVPEEGTPADTREFITEMASYLETVSPGIGLHFAGRPPAWGELMGRMVKEGWMEKLHSGRGPFHRVGSVAGVQKLAFRASELEEILYEKTALERLAGVASTWRSDGIRYVIYVGVGGVEPLGNMMNSWPAGFGAVKIFPLEHIDPGEIEALRKRLIQAEATPWERGWIKLGSSKVEERVWRLAIKMSALVVVSKGLREESKEEVQGLTSLVNEAFGKVDQNKPFKHVLFFADPPRRPDDRTALGWNWAQSIGAQRFPLQFDGGRELLKRFLHPGLPYAFLLALRGVSPKKVFEKTAALDHKGVAQDAFLRLAAWFEGYIREGKNQAILILPPLLEGLGPMSARSLEPGLLTAEGESPMVSYDMPLDPGFYPPAAESRAVFIHVRREGFPDPNSEAVENLRRTGHPVAEIILPDNLPVAFALWMEGMFRMAAVLGAMEEKNAVSTPLVPAYDETLGANKNQVPEPPEQTSRFLSIGLNDDGVFASGRLSSEEVKALLDRAGLEKADAADRYAAALFLLHRQTKINGPEIGEIRFFGSPTPSLEEALKGGQRVLFGLLKKVVRLVRRTHTDYQGSLARPVSGAPVLLETMVWRTKPASTSWQSQKPDAQRLLRGDPLRLRLYAARRSIETSPRRPPYVYLMLSDGEDHGAQDLRHFFKKVESRFKEFESKSAGASPSASPNSVGLGERWKGFSSRLGFPGWLLMGVLFLGVLTFFVFPDVFAALLHFLFPSGLEDTWSNFMMGFGLIVGSTPAVGRPSTEFQGAISITSGGPLERELLGGPAGSLEISRLNVHLAQVRAFVDREREGSRFAREALSDSLGLWKLTGADGALSEDAVLRSGAALVEHFRRPAHRAGLAPGIFNALASFGEFLAAGSSAEWTRWVAVLQRGFNGGLMDARESILSALKDKRPIVLELSETLLRGKPTERDQTTLAQLNVLAGHGEALGNGQLTWLLPRAGADLNTLWASDPGLGVLGTARIPSVVKTDLSKVGNQYSLQDLLFAVQGRRALKDLQPVDLIVSNGEEWNLDLPAHLVQLLITLTNGLLFRAGSRFDQESKYADVLNAAA